MVWFVMIVIVAIGVACILVSIAPHSPHDA